MNEKNETEIEAILELDQKDQIDKRLGNTNNQSPLHTYWCFTYNNYDLDQIDQIVQVLNHICDWYLFQEEIGTNGTPHLQGTLKLKKKLRLSSLKKIENKIHWEATKQISASILYCCKKESRVGKQWVYNITIPEEVNIINDLYPWQKDLMSVLLEEPDDRTIHWIWENVGNVGKTSFSKYLCVKYDAIVLNGKSNDIFYGVQQRLLNKKPLKIVIIDCPRSMMDYINYSSIEKVKDGIFFSGKYEGGMCLYNSPHVIVFANEPPKLDKMSLDRWKILEIGREPPRRIYNNTMS
nr:MAG: replication associated protein [Arizlama virus]